MSRLIDADALIAWTDNYCVDEKFTVAHFANMVRDMPSVQPEHKTGRWMFGFNNQYLEKYYYCSNCGCRKYEEEEPSDYFCPRCGADMRGQNENE